jgi:hypothetical protein
MNKLIERGRKRSLATLSLMLLLFVGVLLPITGILLMLGNRTVKTMKNPETLVTTFKEQLSVWEDKVG